MDQGSGGNGRRALALSFWLGTAWLLWSGRTDPLLLGLGVLSCAFVLWLSLRMGVVDPESEPYELGARPLLYVPWLLFEIARANLHVARVILQPSLPIEPRLLRLRTSQHSDLGNAIYANSITLTPGTVTLDVRERGILVHALTRQSAEGLESGEMDRRVSWLEGAG